MLSDPESRTIRALNILNETVPRDSPNYGIPYPGSFLVDANGRIVAKFFEDDYRERQTAGSILADRFGLIPAQAKSEVEGRQLNLTASASDSTVTAGQKITLALEINLRPNMHLYAPGVEGYIAVDWKAKDSAAARAGDVRYPASEKLYLKAIDETVPVYRDRFRLIRDITIGQDAAVQPLLDPSGQIIVEGSLRYQACDDRVCYIPQELPLKWSFRYEALDRERAPADLQHRPQPTR